MKIVDRYVLRSHIGPFFFGFCIITGVLFVELLKNFLDEFLAKGISTLTIAEVLMLSLGHTLALSIPMSVLLATLMTFGQLAADNELTALKASGVNLYRVMAPVFIAAILLGAVMVVFNNYVLPESNHRLAGLTSDIARKRPTVEIEPGVFVDNYKDFELMVGDRDPKTDQVRDVQVYVLQSGRNPDILVAPRGRLHFENGGNTLYIDLYDGELHSIPESAGPEETAYRVTRFIEHTVVIHDVGSQLERTERQYRSDREMSIGMMRDAVREKRDRIQEHLQSIQKQASTSTQLKLRLLDPAKRAEYFRTHHPLPAGQLMAGGEERIRDTAHIEASGIDGYTRQIRSLQVEIHKKYSIPFACMVFVLLGAPLAIRSGKSGMTMAIAFSISCFFIYYLFLTGGEKLADRELLSPFLAMWLANIFFGILGLYLTWSTVTESSVINWSRLDPRHWRPARRTPAA